MIYAPPQDPKCRMRLGTDEHGPFVAVRNNPSVTLGGGFMRWRIYDADEFHLVASRLDLLTDEDEVKAARHLGLAPGRGRG